MTGREYRRDITLPARATSAAVIGWSAMLAGGAITWTLLIGAILVL